MHRGELEPLTKQKLPLKTSGSWFVYFDYSREAKCLMVRHI